MTVHTRDEIEHRLRLGLVPQTDNRDALIEMGFLPAYPQMPHDPYYARIWTRPIDVDAARHGGEPGRVAAARARRRLALQRAFLVDPPIVVA